MQTRFLTLCGATWARKSVVGAGLVILAFLHPASPPATAAELGQVEALCFTPGNNCVGLITQAIGQAERRIFVQAFSFTHPDILRALLTAKKRGVVVEVLLDESQTRQKKQQTAASALTLAGVPVRIDTRHQYAHNKVMVFDDRRVLTGSFNFSRSAQEANAENVVVLAGQVAAAAYRRNGELHWDHAQPYRPAEAPPRERDMWSILTGKGD